MTEFSNNIPNHKRAFTLIEVLVGVFLILVVFLGIFTAYRLGLKVVGHSKSKIIASTIANQEIEKMRNMPYSLIGIEGASLPTPEGIFEANSSIIRNGIEYIIERQIKFIVDEADGIGGGDTCDWDYKRMEIKISWSGLFQGEVVLVTDIAPKDKVEEIAACSAQPGGILSVTVFDAFGKWEGRGAPLIEVFDSESGVRIDFFEPSDGKHDFPLAASIYKVVVSKSGYSSERTYGIDEIAAPEKSNPIISEGGFEGISFSIDKVSTLSIDTVSIVGEEVVPVPNAVFHLQGEKIIGTDEDEDPVYKYSQDHISGEDGHIDIANLEWDSYNFSIDPTTGLDLESTDPSPQPIGLFPDTVLPVILYLKAQNSLLVIVRDIETQDPIFSADVRLYNEGLSYDVTQYTDEKGQTCFIPLEADTYSIEVQGPGYSSYSGAVSISGDEIKIVELEEVE